MHVLALVAMLIGAIGGIAKLAGVTNLVEPIDAIPLAVWGGIFGVSLVVWFITRRPSD